MSRTLCKKILPQYFEEVKEGLKDFELRKDDSGYEVGDILILQEYLNNSCITGRTGKEITKRIKYILRNCPQYGLQEGYCILGLEDIETE
jgi:hypothetical protein